MSDNIPFELQEQIINKLPVKPLLRFRTVCKEWKSLIDSPDFIIHHLSQQKHQNLLIRYKDAVTFEEKYVSLVDHDVDHNIINTDTLPQHKVSVSVPQLVNNLYNYYRTIDSSYGLLCLFTEPDRAVIWNPSVRKAVEVVVPDMADDEMYTAVLGFGVCRETTDAKIVKVSIDMEGVIPWQVQVFTLSTNVWRSAYSANVPRKFVRFGREQVVVGGVVYWLATGLGRDRVYGGDESYNFIVSFDLTSEEFGKVKLPGRLAHTRCNLSIFKMRESLVVIEGGLGDFELVDHVWMMEDGVAPKFKKLFTIGSHSLDDTIVCVSGFRKTGEPLVELQAHPGFTRMLAAYEPYSKSVSSLGINERYISVYSYTETLLLL